VRSWQLQQTSGESVVGNVEVIIFLLLPRSCTKKVAGARRCQPELLDSPALGKAS
jgi:hypothetical protein